MPIISEAVEIANCGLPMFCFNFSSEITSVEQLPRPKPVSRAPMTEAFMAQNPTGTVSMQIEINDWITFD